MFVTGKGMMPGMVQAKVIAHAHNGQLHVHKRWSTVGERTFYAVLLASDACCGRSNELGGSWACVDARKDSSFDPRGVRGCCWVKKLMGGKRVDTAGMDAERKDRD